MIASNSIVRLAISNSGFLQLISTVLHWIYM